MKETVKPGWYDLPHLKPKLEQLKQDNNDTVLWIRRFPIYVWDCKIGNFILKDGVYQPDLQFIKNAGLKIDETSRPFGSTKQEAHEWFMNNFVYQYVDLNQVMKWFHSCCPDSSLILTRIEIPRCDG